MPQFIMIGFDVADGAARREKSREQHLGYIDKHYQEGRVIFAGPIRNETDTASTGAVIVYEAADLAAAKALVDGDPYVSGGVFDTLTVAPFKRVFPKDS